jgi:hypothetical protein
MRRRIGSLALLLLLPGFGAAAQTERDAKADAVGRELIAALGGTGAWEKARQFRFDFVVEREGKALARFSHAWDRYTGDYRLQGTEKAGAPYEVYFNVNTRAGEAFVNGRPPEQSAAADLVKTAYGRFINDSYWLLAPWKIFDPGVHLAYDAEKPCPEGGVCDVLKLSFDPEVGLTPRDVYWLWITRDGRRMVQWQYVLGGAPDEPTAALWRDWQRFAGVSLALEKAMVGKPVVIRFENVSISASRDPALFKPPAS